jgi:hypothetical protein
MLDLAPKERLSPKQRSCAFAIGPPCVSLAGGGASVVQQFLSAGLLRTFGTHASTGGREPNRSAEVSWSARYPPREPP